MLLGLKVIKKQEGAHVDKNEAINEALEVKALNI
jgi:hypothetical protein